MLKVTPGSTIVGKTGRKLLVDRIEGDLLICGNLRIDIGAVVKVIPPPSPTPSYSEPSPSPSPSQLKKKQDIDRELENIKSVTQTLLVVVGMSDEQALEALTDLRQVWKKEWLQTAASHLPTSARSRLKELVIKSNG